MSRKLYSKKFIDRSVHCNVTNSQIAINNKANMLMNALETFLLSHNKPGEVIMSLVGIFEQCSPIGHNVAESIRKVRVSINTLITYFNGLITMIE